MHSCAPRKIRCTWPYCGAISTHPPIQILRPASASTVKEMVGSSAYPGMPATCKLKKKMAPALHNKIVFSLVTVVSIRNSIRSNSLPDHRCHYYHKEQVCCAWQSWINNRYHICPILVHTFFFWGSQAHILIWLTFECKVILFLLPRIFGNHCQASSRTRILWLIEVGKYDTYVD